MSKKPTLLFSLSLVLVVLLPGTAFPHDGGLDSYGCHHNHKEGGYHCHQGTFDGRSFSTKAAMLQQARQLAPQPSETPAPDPQLSETPAPDPQLSETPAPDPQQQVIPTPKLTSIATSSLSMQAKDGYQKCLNVIDGETVQLALVEQRSSVNLRETESQTAQTGPCASIFDVYSNSEIVDIVVRLRQARMTIVGGIIPEMLGKAADPYVTAATTCQDLTRAHVSPGTLTNTLRMKRNKRVRQVHCIAEYRQQMQATAAKSPLEQLAAKNKSRATNAHDLFDTKKAVTTTAQE